MYLLVETFYGYAVRQHKVTFTSCRMLSCKIFCKHLLIVEHQYLHPTLAIFYAPVYAKTTIELCRPASQTLLEFLHVEDKCLAVPDNCDSEQ